MRLPEAEGFDTSLWMLVDERVGDNLALRESVVVIAELAAKLFAAPVPLLVRGWGEKIRPATRIWIENYALRCACCVVPSYELCLLPRAKLVRFLQQQYEGVRVQRHSMPNRLVTFSRLSRIVSSIKENPSLLLQAGWWRRQLLIRRSLFHGMTGLRYVCEIPRWRWLNRTRMRSASPAA
jgi:hypothetical protein